MNIARSRYLTCTVRIMDAGFVDHRIDIYRLNLQFSLYFSLLFGICEAGGRFACDCKPPPLSLTIRHFVETCGISPPVAGFLKARLKSPCLRSGQTAHFGPPSPRRKSPFLAPKRCGGEQLRLPAVARLKVKLQVMTNTSIFVLSTLRLLKLATARLSIKNSAEDYGGV